MKFSVTSDVGKTRLFEVLRWNYRRLDKTRKIRTDLIARYAGSLFTGESRPTALPFMLQAAEAFVMGIAANRPRVQIVAKRQRQKEFAKHYETALNTLIMEIRLEDTLQAIALDAFFGPAFAKVYLGDSPNVLMEGDLWMDPGQPYVDRLSLDDKVWDTCAKDYRKCVVMADRYRLPLWLVKEDKTRFNPRVTKDLEPTRNHGDEEADSAEWLSHGGEENIDDGDFEPMVDLCDVYIPRDKRIYTFVTDSGFNLRFTRPLAEQDWTGAETGPYHYLNMGPVPDNVLPSAPGYNLKFFDKQLNNMQRKLASQAERQKTLTMVPVSLLDDGVDLGNANDGEQVVVNGPADAIVERRFGGPDNNLLGGMQAMLSLADRFAGNLRTRAGLGPSADTLGQDQLIQSNVSRVEAAQQAKFTRFTREVCAALGKLLFEDEVRVVPGVRRYEGTSIEVADDWRGAVEEGSRVGEWKDYEFCIAPYSQPYQSPSQRVNTLRENVQFIAQVAQFDASFKAAGIEPRWNELINTLADYTNSPETKEFLNTGRLPEYTEGYSRGGGQSAMSQGNKPGGVYTRRNVSGDDQEFAEELSMMTPHAEGAAA